MSATTDVTVKFLAAKDASFDKTNADVKSSIDGLKRAQTIAATTGDTTALKAANAELSRMIGQLTKAKKEATDLATQLGKFKFSAPSTAVGAGGGGSRAGGSVGGKTLPAELQEQAGKASQALAALRAQLQQTALVGTGIQQLPGLRAGALELAKWRQENQALVSQVPQLRAEYQSATGQLRIATAEARILAAAEARVAAEARKVAQEQLRAADAAKRADARAAIEAQKRLAQEAEKAARYTRESLTSLASLGQQAGLVVAGAGAVLTALAVSAVRTAGSFEQLQARLSSVVKNGQQANQIFEQAVSLASVTPFSVSGIVQASVTLSAFQVNARQVLPQVANLAAGMGKSVEDAALVLGKALSGSYEGFESLRNEAGISNADLKKFGATLTSTGSLSLVTARDLDKASAALLKIVQSRFGDAAERQSKTLVGALSNVADAIERTAAAFGKSLVPVARVAAKQVEGFFSILEGLPNGTKALIAFGVAGTGALATIAGGAVFAGGHILGLGLQLLELKNKLPEKAVESLTKKFGSLANAASGIANSGLARFLAGTTGVLLGFGLAAEAADTACKLYLEHLKQLDDQVVQAAKGYHEAFRSAKDYSTAINNIGGQNFVTDTHSAETAASGMAAALKAIPLPQLIGGLQAAGFTFKQLERDIESNKAQTEAYTKQQKALQDLLDKGGNNGGKLLDQEYGEGGLQDRRVNVSQLGLSPLFDNQDVVKVTEIRDKLKQLNGAINNLKGGAVVLEGLRKGWKGFADPMNQAVEKSKELENYLEFSKGAKDLFTMQQNLKLLTQDLDNFKTKARQAQLPTTEAGALDRLRVAKGDEIEFQKAFIKRFEERKQAEAALVAYQRDLAQERLTQLDRLHAREVSDSDATLDSKRSDLKNERVYLEQRLALVDGAVAEEMKLVRQLNELNRQVANPVREAALEYVKQRLKAIRETSDEQVETQAKLRANKKVSLALEVQDAQQALDETTKSSLDFVKDLKENGAGSPEVLKAYDRVLVRLEAWREKNQKLINQSPELQKALDGVRRQVEGGSRQERSAQRAENLRGIQGKLGEDLAGEVSLAEKLAAVKRTIEKINQSIAAGTVERQAGETAVLALEKQQAQLLKQQEQQKAQFAIERLSIERSAIDQEIAILEQRKTAGENVESQLAALRQERLQAAITAIELEADAEIKANGDKEQAEFKRAAAIKALLRSEYLDQVKKYSDEEAAAEEHQKKLDGIKSSRSPLQSIDESFADLPSLTFDIDSTKRAFAKKKAPSPFDIAAKLNLDGRTSQTLEQAVQAPLYRQTNPRPVGFPGLSSVETPLARIAADARRNFTPSQQLSDQINQSERNKKEALRQRPGGTDFQSGQGGGSPGGQGSGAGSGGSVNNFNNTFNAKPFDSPEFERACEAVFVKKMNSVRLRRS